MNIFNMIREFFLEWSRSFMIREFFLEWSRSFKIMHNVIFNFKLQSLTLNISTGKRVVAL